jgi:hypothetical protein
MQEHFVYYCHAMARLTVICFSRMDNILSIFRMKQLTERKLDKYNRKPLLKRRLSTG